MIILWAIVLITNLPQLYLYSAYEYLNENETRAVCILKYNIILSEASINDTSVQTAEFDLQVYYSIFIMFAYIIPLVSIVIIYALIFIRISKSKGIKYKKIENLLLFFLSKMKIFV